MIRLTVYRPKPVQPSWFKKMAKPLASGKWREPDFRGKLHMCNPQSAAPEDGEPDDPSTIFRDVLKGIVKVPKAEVEAEERKRQAVKKRRLARLKKKK
jgi:hypothetical protein